MRWRFYDLQTGVMATRLFTGSLESVESNLKPGVGALPDVDYDPLSQRVDISVQPPPPPVEVDPGNGFPQYTPEAPPWYPPVIDYQPPAPAADQWQTWTWDAGIKRWVSVPTLLAHKRAARQRMAAAWNEARQAGVTIGTKTAPTDADSWTRYLAIKEMASEGGWIDVPIPLADGSFELMTQAKMVTLWNGLKAMERTLLTQLRDKVEQIDAATTPAEVEAVVWT